MAVEVIRRSTEIEVLSEKTVVSETNEVTHVVEVLRHDIQPVDITKPFNVVEVVRPGGTVVNVGAGPDLPENPYEGLIWIKT